MKQLVSLGMMACAIAFANNAQACIVMNSSSPDVRETVDQLGGWPITDAKCEFLKKRNLYLAVSATKTVLNGTSVGWASIRLLNKDNVSSDASMRSTHVHSEASMNVAEKMMYEALRDSIARLDFEVAANEVAKYEKAARAR